MKGHRYIVGLKLVSKTVKIQVLKKNKKKFARKVAQFKISGFEL